MDILYKIKEYFKGIGNIYIRKDSEKMWLLCTKYKSCKIIPHFEN